MTQKTDHTTWRLKQWAGTLDAVVRAGNLAAQRVAAAAPFPEGYEPWGPEQLHVAETVSAARRAERARQVEIAVGEKDGYTRTLTAPSDLGDLAPDRPGNINVIHMEIGGTGWQAPSAEITAARRSGLEVKLAGPDRQWTAGLRHELEEILTPRERLRPRGLPNDDALGLVAILTFAVTLGAVSATLKAISPWENGVCNAISGVSALLVAGFLLLVASRCPNFELLALGTRPVYQRLRTRIVAGAVALGLGIAATLIGGAITG